MRTLKALAFFALAPALGCASAAAPNPPPDAKPCTREAMVCPDGSTVGRTGPNCEFAPCPGAGVAPPAASR